MRAPKGNVAGRRDGEKRRDDARNGEDGLDSPGYLTHLGLPTVPPALSPARLDPQGDLAVEVAEDDSGPAEPAPARWTPELRCHVNHEMWA